MSSMASRLGLSPPAPVGGPEKTASARRGVSDASPPPRQTEVPSINPLDELKARIQKQLYDELGPKLYDATIESSDIAGMVDASIVSILKASSVHLNDREQQQLVTAIHDDILGLGPIQPWIDDPTVSEIMVNGPNKIFVERKGRIERTSAHFSSEQHLRQIIDRIVAPIGRRIDESSPMVDARLANGSRVNAIIPPLAVRGSSLTIRKFPDKALLIEDLIRFGSLSQSAADFLKAAVAGGLNVLVSGGTGTGKTTLLNVLSSFIPESERIVTIEDSVELRLTHDNLVTLEARPSNSEGHGAVEIRDLVRNALRMRPDRIVVGECRGGEALDMLQAMNTGHEGSLTTIHANTPRDLLSRLETMVLMAELDLPARAIRDQIASAIQIIVQLHRMHDGRRAVVAVSEIAGMENDRILLSDIFTFDWNAPPPNDKSGNGQLVATGVRPKSEVRLRERGFDLPAEMFAETRLL